MPDLSVSRAIDIVDFLMKYRKDVINEADGADDRIYPTEEQWDAIETLLEECKGEF